MSCYWEAVAVVSIISTKEDRLKNLYGSTLEGQIDLTSHSKVHFRE